MVMSSLLNISVGLGAVRLLMLHDCKLNGRLSFNVDGHVDNDLLILCSMPLTIIVRLVFNIKTCYEQHNMFINTLASVHCLAYCPIDVHIHTLFSYCVM